MVIKTEFVDFMIHSLESIKSEKIELWQKDLEERITEIFLYDNYYRLNISTVEKNNLPARQYTIIDTQSYFPIDEQISVYHFLNNLTGSEKWDEENGLRTHALDLQDYITGLLIKEIDTVIIKSGYKIEELEEISSEDIILDERFYEKFVDCIESFWKNLVELNLKKVIDRNFKVVHEKFVNENIKKDIYRLKEEHDFKKYNLLEKEILQLFILSHTKKLSPRHKEEISLLQVWASNKSFEEIKLFNRYYPMLKSLKNFRWLDKDIYEKKQKEYKEAKNRVTSLLSSYGSVRKDVKVPFYIRQLYNLQNEIFDLKGDKFVYITNEDENDCIRFFIDKYGRVGNVIEDYVLFLNILEKALVKGSVLVREVSDEKYLLKRGTKTISNNSFNIYGVLMNNNHYRGLNSEEIREIYTNNSQSGDFLPEEEGDSFKDWDIGNSISRN